MALIEELAPIANSSAFIFTGDVIEPSDTPTRKDSRTVIGVVRDVIKAPDGMGGLVGREVTVRLREPLSDGSYVFFADLVSAGSAITLSETAHLDGKQRGEAEAAMERGYAERLTPRLEAAWLVALGTIGDVNPVFTPAHRAGRVPWALARLDIERVLKGPRSRRRLTLIGPSPATKRLPRVPALRPGVHAILLLQRPPDEAMEHIPTRERQASGFIADTADIQPPDRVEELVRILGATKRK